MLSELSALRNVEILNTVVKDIYDKDVELNKQIVEYNYQIQDILHYIENKKFNASDSCKIIKLLKKVRKDRREIKNEAARYESLKNILTNSTNLLANEISVKSENISYQFRTNVLEELTGYKKGEKMYFGEVTKISDSITKEDTETSDNTLTDLNTDTNETELINAMLDHPEGRRIVLTSVSNGRHVECKNFESAVMTAIGGARAANSKPSELVKNVSGAMKALKLGTEYLGYRWEVRRCLNLMK